MVLYKCNASWEETLPGKLLLTFVIYFNNFSKAFKMLKLKWRFGFHKIITGEYYNGFLDALAQVSRVAQHQVHASPPQVMATTSWNTWNMYTGWPGTRLGHAERWPDPFPGHLIWLLRVVLFLCERHGAFDDLAWVEDPLYWA